MINKSGDQSFLPSAIPAARQLEYQDWEMGLFLHFGIRTFFEGIRDWKGASLPARAFRPAGLDCDQWAATARRAGMKYAVMTCKQYDGFSLWPSRFSDYSVAQSPWKEGQGDAVREFTDACRRHGLKIGL